LLRRAPAIFLALEREIGRAHPSRVAVQGNCACLVAAMGKSEAQPRAAIAVLRREAGLGPS
jgi:hypothetical protein